MQSQWKKHICQREKHVRQRLVKKIFIQTVDKFCKQKDCKIRTLSTQIDLQFFLKKKKKKFLYF